MTTTELCLMVLGTATALLGLVACGCLVVALFVANVVEPWRCRLYEQGLAFHRDRLASVAGRFMDDPPVRALLEGLAHGDADRACEDYRAAREKKGK